MTSSVVESVLAQYPDDCCSSLIEDLASAGGFSGARFWRITAPRGRLCLRRWPAEHPSAQQLHFIHSLLRHVERNGFAKVPVPIMPSAGIGTSYVDQAGHLWELTPWLAGAADFGTSPSLKKLQAAARALAEFHRAAASFPSEFDGPRSPPAIIDRLKLTADWINGNLDRLVTAMQACGPADWPELFHAGRRIADHFRAQGGAIARQLNEVSEILVEIQPCIRDIWDQHILFEGAEVAGIVDFGAARRDTVATDIARLLGSLVADSPAKWEIGLQAYCEVRSLSDNERRLIDVLDRSSVPLSGLNWLSWVYVENRQFVARKAVEGRIEAILQRLSHVK